MPSPTSSPSMSDTIEKPKVPPVQEEVQSHKVREVRKLKPVHVQRFDSALVTSSAADASMSEPPKDSNAQIRFFLRQSLANSLGTPSNVTERPPVHPHSMTWEDIAGIPQPHKETPGWIKALGYLRIAAIILGFTYLIFFDK